ncbi:MAG: molybdenum cofactor biosynthesis protein MoaE, partial [Gammaproteobacteria bacterium]|nr:molybdenum cofactor biosynthesis protein MoaE [Gammaproteobacteria bacterium]
MSIRIQQEIFDPWGALSSYESEALDQSGAKIGATAVFVGSMRDFNQDASVIAMTLEHYPGMTEAYLEKISAEARSRWSIQDSLIVHRFGPIVPGEPIVLVAAWSAHRDAA